MSKDHNAKVAEHGGVKLTWLRVKLKEIQRLRINQRPNWNILRPITTLYKALKSKDPMKKGHGWN